jgi:hypothetical protein
MIIQPIEVIQNNYGYELGPWTLEDGSGNAQNLTAATVLLNVQDSQDPSGALLFSGSVTIDNAVGGLVHYTVSNSNFANTGVFLAQIVATYSGEQVSWPTFQIKVLPALPQPNN